MYDNADGWREEVWRGGPKGFWAGLAHARELECTGKDVAADVQAASIYYSYRWLPFYGRRARRIAFQVYSMWWEQEVHLTPAQLQTLADILLRGRKYHQWAALALAENIFPEFDQLRPHEEALAWTSLADIVARLRPPIVRVCFSPKDSPKACHTHNDPQAGHFAWKALGCDQAIFEEGGPQPLRQWVRVARRCGLILFRARVFEHDRSDGRRYVCKAFTLARRLGGLQWLKVLPARVRVALPF